MRLLKSGLPFFAFLLSCSPLFAQQKLVIKIDSTIAQSSSRMFNEPTNPLIQYTGRIEKTTKSLIRFWAPGVYVKAKFKGNNCIVYLNDEVLYGTVHNYIEIVIDDQKPMRVQLKYARNAITVNDLSKGDHTILICKDTEAENGYLDFAGIDCKKLLPTPPKPKLKIEFIGNSITCGFGADMSEIPCGKRDWYDEHNAYMSYGARTARALNAQWHLTAVSGIGMMHSCCNLPILMPQVFDKINMRRDSIQWDFKQYIPDIVTICLGQNDGIQDSATFCKTYVDFVKTVRSKYANATIILLTSPMGDSKLTAVLKNYLTSIVSFFNENGEKNIDKYFFKKQYHEGCGGHPSVAEHKEISDELVGFMKKKKIGE
jgi:hypothetical protein